jgi:hypothetical protein
MKPERILRWKRSSTGNCFLNIGKKKKVAVFLRAEDGRYGIHMFGQHTPDTYAAESEAIDAVHALLLKNEKEIVHMKTAEYYAEVRKQAARLDEQFPQGFCLLTSVANRDKGTVAGNVTEVANDNAARCLAEATHRLATPEEVESWREHQERNRQVAQTTEYMRDGQRIIWRGGAR